MTDTAVRTPSEPGFRDSAAEAVALARRGDDAGACALLDAAREGAAASGDHAFLPVLAARQAEVCAEAARLAHALVRARWALRLDDGLPPETRATAQSVLAEALMDAGLTDSALAEAQRAIRASDDARDSAESLRARRRASLVHAEALIHEGRSHAAALVLDRMPDRSEDDSARFRARMLAARAAILTDAGQAPEAAALLGDCPAELFDAPVCRGALVLALEARRRAMRSPPSFAVADAAERMVSEAARAFLQIGPPTGERAVVLAALRIADLPVLRMRRDLVDALRDVARSNAAARALEIDAACRDAREAADLPRPDLALLAAWRTRIEALPKDPDDPFRRA
ncbi:MAG: hypothetical protein HMLKMBBP_01746 [Planctomycetes bacterium]|nr:hypothetical protein [Planctomycetota bacterium]